jgi:hypothetical protein
VNGHQRAGTTAVLPEPDQLPFWGDVFFLHMPLRGRSSVAQDGRRADLRPGDFAVVDGARPFTLDFEGSFEQLSLILPHDLLMPLLATPEVMTARAVRGDEGLGAIASGALRPLFDGAGAGVGIDGGMARWRSAAPALPPSPPARARRSPRRRSTRSSARSATPN